MWIDLVRERIFLYILVENVVEQILKFLFDKFHFIERNFMLLTDLTSILSLAEGPEFSTSFFFEYMKEVYNGVDMELMPETQEMHGKSCQRHLEIWSLERQTEVVG
jgi:hypothetical protein